METQNAPKLPGGDALTISNGKASGDNAAAAKIADCMGKTPSPQAALEIGSTKMPDMYGK